MKRHLYILMTAVMCMMYLPASAQWNFDVSSVEALISDHKSQRELLTARAVLEECNKVLHGKSKDANVGYKDINEELDKYNRAFDVISLLYESLHTCMNVYNTYNTVSDRISDYRKMLTDFNNKCLSHGNIVTTDSLILTVNYKMIENVAGEGENLYKSVSDLILYVSGQASCTTADLIMTVTAINTSLDNIQMHLNTAYYETWRYIQMRIGYWKKQVYRAQTKEDIVNDALSRWRKSGRLEKE